VWHCQVYTRNYTCDSIKSEHEVPFWNGALCLNSSLYFKECGFEPVYVCTLLNMITAWQNKTSEEALCKHESDVWAFWNARLMGALAEAVVLRFLSGESRGRAYLDEQRRELQRTFQETTAEAARVVQERYRDSIRNRRCFFIVRSKSEDVYCSRLHALQMHSLLFCTLMLTCCRLNCHSSSQETPRLLWKPNVLMFSQEPPIGRYLEPDVSSP
jgi:hypothetical protein